MLERIEIDTRNIDFEKKITALVSSLEYRDKKFTETYKSVDTIEQVELMKEELLSVISDLLSIINIIDVLDDKYTIVGRDEVSRSCKIKINEFLESIAVLGGLVMMKKWSLESMN